MLSQTGHHQGDRGREGQGLRRLRSGGQGGPGAPRPGRRSGCDSTSTTCSRSTASRTCCCPRRERIAGLELGQERGRAPRRTRAARTGLRFAALRRGRADHPGCHPAGIDKRLRATAGSAERDDGGRPSPAPRATMPVSAPRWATAPTTPPAATCCSCPSGGGFAVRAMSPQGQGLPGSG